MKALFIALVLVGCGAANGGEPGERAAADLSPGGSSGQDAPQGQPSASAGQAGADSSPVLLDTAAPVNQDKLLGPCGPLNCPAPTLGWAIGGGFGCFDGVCTFDCLTNGPIDPLLAYCASAGGHCGGHGTAVICEK